MSENKKSKFELAAEEVGRLVTEKNKFYGNSFEQTGEFLKILYPNGIPVEAYTDALCLVRMFDKMKRIATHKNAYGESSYKDLAGYSILGYVKDSEELSCNNNIDIGPQTLITDDKCNKEDEAIAISQQFFSEEQIGKWKNGEAVLPLKTSINEEKEAEQAVNMDHD